MLKFLLILFLVGYVLYKVMGFAFKVLFYNASRAQGTQQKQTQYNSQHYAKKPADGNLNIDYVPKNASKDKNDFQGGEYVDYEEVK